MLTDLDRLLLLVNKDQGPEDRDAAVDLLLDSSRIKEAERLLLPGRVLVRYTEGHCWVDTVRRDLRTYCGVCVGDELNQLGVIVYARFGDRELDRELIEPGPSLALRNHSPTGFAWGYQGSGPAQLALAILLHCCGQQLAVKHYQDFKRLRVSTWPKGGWKIDEEVIWRLVDTLECPAALAADRITQLP